MRVAYIRLAVLALFLLAAYVTYTTSSPPDEGMLQVTFLDVGQGDAIFIESPTGVQVLIDGGRNAGVLRELSRELGFFDRTIDLILATHPDQDHIGGLVDVLERYEVGMVVLTENRGDTGSAEEFGRRVEAEGAVVSYARRGMTYDLGGGATLHILFPDRDPEMLESNASSIIALLAYGEHEFLFTGDAPKSIEDYLVVLGDDLESEVLKVGHHGSDTSTSEPFLSAVRPVYAIISAGADNPYGHPHQAVVGVLEAAGATTKNTAEEGSITFVSDGVTLELK